MEKKKRLKKLQLAVQFFAALLLIFFSVHSLLFSYSVNGLRHPRPLLHVDTVLFPDWDVLVILHVIHGRPLCLFQDGSTSSANFSSQLPSSGRAAFRCAVPLPLRGLRPLLPPRVILPDALLSPPDSFPRWTFLVYDSLSTPDDVIVFAKGVNGRRDRPSDDVSCVFHEPGAATWRTRAKSSSQEVFRCSHPPSSLPEGTRISLEIKNKAVPSVAQYRPIKKTGPIAESNLCACTMVFNVAKFLQEWVTYHARMGVERFILYDNGSEDGLDRTVAELDRNGYNVSTVPWPWPKTQEAAFSHCAATAKDACRWMAFLDVDEFVFSSSDSAGPVLGSVLARLDSRVGQLSMDCFDFGPSNRTAHPLEGVTQGYTCRRRTTERHKSIVRLGAVDYSLRNVIHHFSLREGYVAEKERGLVVNHYKYQAWPEFKAKFRRRASAFVVDWTEETNVESKDRAPGLGFAAVEPPDWSGRFCEVVDERLRDLVRLWFCSPGDCRLPWETSIRP